MLVTLIPLFDENMVVSAYSLFTQKENYFLNPSRLGTGMFDGASQVEGLEVIKSMGMEQSITPKSVSAATSLYLPKITKDFPDFHYGEMKTRAENVLISYLRSVDAQNTNLLTEGTSELKDSLRMRIESLRNSGQKEHFQNIKIHRTEISQYRKTKGRCSVVLQSAVEYIHYVEKDGSIKKGRNDMREQSKYDIEVIYIQDRDLVENHEDAGLAMNCPNCGAPLPMLGAKICKYCDSPVVEFNIRTWNFAAVKER